jgi:hypothetical protein
MEVFFKRVEIQAFELFSVAETLSHRVGAGGVLTQNIEIQAIRPPVPARGTASSCMVKRAFIVRHGDISFLIRE